MRAIQVNGTGGPDQLQVADLPEPQPGEGQVRIRVAAVGVNFIDIYHRKGVYPRSMPFVPGAEVAGTVDAVGPGVADLEVGDRVATAAAGGGAYAELAVASADQVVAVPPGVELETAAGLLLQGITAHYLATSTFPLAPSHRALVHAAAGGVGLLLTQIAARHRGATVYGTASTPEKVELALAAGATQVIRYTAADVVEEVRRLTGGAGLDVVYDSVGRDTFDASLQCLRPRGMLVLFGQSSGTVDPFEPQRLAAAGSLYLTRPLIVHYTADVDELRWRTGELFDWLAAGQLDVRIGETHPLAEAAEAHRRLEGRKTTGKVLLIP
jgi:NADPH:quinone reductase